MVEGQQKEAQLQDWWTDAVSDDYREEVAMISAFGHMGR